jgi:hypothetical protein
MGQLDKTSRLAFTFTENLLLPPMMWQQLLGPSHDVTLMPYEQAEIEEYSLEVDEALDRISHAHL